MTTAARGAHGRSARDAALEAITSLRPRHTALTDDTTLTELGFDSLDRLTVAVAVEQATGVAIPGTVLPELRTVADLIITLEEGQAP